FEYFWIVWHLKTCFGMDVVILTVFGIMDMINSDIFWLSKLNLGKNRVIKSLEFVQEPTKEKIKEKEYSIFKIVFEKIE
ncbi:MAG: hypothetical protein OXC46_00480, partial [Thaumarchaeota archaeon]|nr:hypothetical protein [Nitrososphaerota archaeon]